MKLWNQLLAVCFAVLLIILGLWFYVASYPVNPRADFYYEVMPGVTSKVVTRDLCQQSSFCSSFVFYHLARIYITRGHNLQAGEYSFPKSSSMLNMLHRMLTGDVITYQVALVNGWNYFQIMAALNVLPKLNHTFATMPPALVAKALGISQEPPEGWFYPDSYQYKKGTTDEQILKTAHLKMEAVLKHEWNIRAENLPYQAPYQALIVASMIEKETRILAEKPLVAGVILNRLARQMPLQIDAAVIYGVWDRYTGELTKKDLASKSLYNTYQHYGLPPTPIALPDDGSLWAALHPAKTDALYYVATGDAAGTHQFSNTLADHEKAVAQYRARKAGK
jgi:UPF0755 protein